MLIEALKYGLSLFGIFALFGAIMIGAIELLGIVGGLVATLLIVCLATGVFMAWEENNVN